MDIVTVMIAVAEHNLADNGSPRRGHYVPSNQNEPHRGSIVYDLR